MKNSKLNLDIQFLLLILIAFSLPFSVKLNSYLIVSFSLVWILGIRNYSFKKPPLIFYTSISYFIFFVLYFILNGKYEWFLFEKRLSLFIFPVFFYFSNLEITTRKLNLILSAFLVGVTIICIYSFLIFKPEPPQEFTYTFFHLNHLMHRPHFGLYIGSAIIILIYFFFTLESTKMKWVYIVLFIFFNCFLYLLFVKAAIISLLLTLVILLFILVKKIIKPKFFVLISAGFIIAISFILNSNFTSISFHIKNITQLNAYAYDQHDGRLVYSVNSRAVFWSCSIDILKRDNNWIFGVRDKDLQGELDTCYNELGQKQYLGFISHNQFLHTWLQLGILGFCVLMISIIFPIIVAYKNRSYFFLAFFLFFWLCAFTEVLFAVQKGVVLFAFMNAIFMLTIKNKDQILKYA